MITETRPTEIRLAMPGDHDEILGMLLAMYDEEYEDPVDPFKVSYVLNRMLLRDGGIVGVIRGKTRIEATLGLRLDQHWYSSAFHIDKIWLYVHPFYRASTHAKALLQFSRMYSDQVAVPLMADEICTPNNAKKVELIGRQIPERGRRFVYNARVRVEVYGPTPPDRHDSVSN